jgi:hypothetical protein
LYDGRDQYHDIASLYFDEYFAKTTNQLVIPFPIVYESFCSRFVKNKRAMTMLENDWKRLEGEKRLSLLSDADLREEVLEECFRDLRLPSASYRTLSFVDRVIRKLLSDTKIRISAFITFNPSDFADVCATFNREMISQ